MSYRGVPPPFSRGDCETREPTLRGQQGVKVATYLKKEAIKSKLYGSHTPPPKTKGASRILCPLYVVLKALTGPESLCRNIVLCSRDSSGISKSEKSVMEKGYYVAGQPSRWYPMTSAPGIQALLQSLPHCTGSSV